MAAAQRRQSDHRIRRAADLLPTLWKRRPRRLLLAQSFYSLVKFLKYFSRVLYFEFQFRNVK